jgi:NAD-dependent dihydropyrimidine dehydrogenase PreA subunit
VDKFTSKVIDGTTYNDQEYYNLYEKKGWSVESIVTNKEEGYVNEFLEKEGKWFNGINKAVDTSIEKADTSDFTFQGIGVASIAHHYGCTDSHAQNYNPLATIDDGSCVFAAPVYGCTDKNASNYDPNATVDDGSCVFAAIYGCTDSHAQNYNPLATIDDGSCVFAAPVYGCTDSHATNYDPNATVDDGSCIFAAVSGCMDSHASNYNPNATIDDGSCILPIIVPVPVPSPLIRPSTTSTDNY